MSQLAVRRVTGGNKGDARDDADDEPHVAPLADLRAVTRRRSSVSVTPSMVAEAAPAISAAMAPAIVAGDQLARPHYLKDRSVTMRPETRLSMSSHSASSGHHSKASSFLVKIVERSRSVASVYDSKPTGSTSNQTGNGHYAGPGTRPQGDEGDAAQGPQRRRQSIVISESHVNKLNQLQHQGMVPAILPPARPPMQGTRAGMPHLTTHEEDEPNEYVTETELRDRTLSQLVRDLSLYKKKSGALVRILGEIQRRLDEAEIESSTGRSSHVALCRDLVEDGVLSSLVHVMREFRFHVALQTAAVALLSFLAEVSDLYAYMMAELDVEPLVEKIVAVHVSQERLVMNGSSLIHTISDGKHKSHGAKMHKALQVEREKKRTASFVEAFAAERKLSKMRELEGLRGRDGGALIRDDQHKPHRGSRWQRSTLSKGLGEPPVLTAHYDLEVSLSRQRSMDLPPLGSVTGDGSDATPIPDDRSLWIRPKTSPEPRHFMRRSSAAKLAAVYLTSSKLMAPSSVGKRPQSTRKTHSAIVYKQKAARSNKNGETRPKALDSFGSGETEVEELPSKPMERSDFNVEINCGVTEATNQAPRLESGATDVDTKQVKGGDLSDEDASYADDDFDNDEDEHDIGDSVTASVNQDRLLPVGSDSDLFELVHHSENVLNRPAEHLLREVSSNIYQDVDHCSPSSPGPSNVISPLTDTDQLTHSSISTKEDTFTAELVGLLTGCVNSKDPTVAVQATEEGTARVVSATTTPKMRNTSRSLSPVLTAPSVTIVRPVSRRILRKAGKSSRRQGSSESYSLSSKVASEKDCMEPKSSRDTAEVTALLDKARHSADNDPVDENEKSGSLTLRSGVCHVQSPLPISTPTSVAHIQALYARGLQHHKANEIEGAIRCYEQAIHLQHSSGVQREFASLYINLGSARMAQNRPYDALVAFTQAQRIQPLNVKAMFNHGLVLMQLAQWEEAIAKFSEVVAADSSHVRAQCALEQCQNVLTQVDKRDGRTA